MAYEMNDNSGSLFAAKDKKTDKHPDREGSAKIGGVEYWVSGWVKQDKNGKPWLSLAFKPKEKTLPAARTDGQRVTSSNAGRHDNALSRPGHGFDDEIPF